MNFKQWVNKKGLTTKPFFITIINQNLPWRKISFEDALQMVKHSIFIDKKFKQMYLKGGVIIGAFKFFNLSILKEEEVKKWQKKKKKKRQRQNMQS